MNAPDETRKPRVAVVFGGRSSEHAISCVTAGSVLAAIDRDRYDVVPIGIATDGRWVLESGDPERLRIESADRLPSVDAERAAGRAGAATDSATDLVVTEPSQPPRTLGEVDVVFPLLHGPWGEDGTIQGMLEMAGVRYVGAGRAGLRGQHGQGLHEGRARRRRAAGDAERHGDRARVGARPGRGAAPGGELGYPLFVKPARGGSSIGISKVHDAAELDAAIEPARSSTTPRCWWRSPPRAPARSSAACCRRSTATAARPACPPRSGSPATTSSTTSRRSTCPRRPPSSTSRPTLPDDVAARDAGAVGARVRGRRLRGPGPRRLLPDARRVAGRQRDQHDARASRRCRCSRGCGRPPASTTRRWSTG